MAHAPRCWGANPAPSSKPCLVVVELSHVSVIGYLPTHLYAFPVVLVSTHVHSSSRQYGHPEPKRMGLKVGHGELVNAKVCDPGR